MNARPARFHEFERVRHEIVHAWIDREGLDDYELQELLHEANNLATAALAWDAFSEKERRSIEERIERLIESWSLRP